MQSGTKDFNEKGFLILRNAISAENCESIRRRVINSLDPIVDPVEYEAEMSYPGAPANRQSIGGSTPRRLLQALDRDSSFRSLALEPTVVTTVRTLLDQHQIAVARSHHNCVMTKHPNFSSDTPWHRDYRFWSFERPQLVTAWFALQSEEPNNGSLRLIPGSHKLNLGRDRFDDHNSLDMSRRANRSLAEFAENVHLFAGDILFFHCQLLHSATRNHTSEVKVSPVFTYHTMDNHAVPGTRSSKFPSVPIRDFF